MRLLPNRLRISLRERTPIAFAKVGDRIELIDVNGVTMAMPLGGNYSFPVIVGNAESDPASTRAAADEDLRRTCPPIGFDWRELLARIGRSGFVGP